MNRGCTVCCVWTGGLINDAQFGLPSIWRDMRLPVLSSLYSISSDSMVFYRDNMTFLLDSSHTSTSWHKPTLPCFDLQPLSLSLLPSISSLAPFCWESLFWYQQAASGSLQSPTTTCSFQSFSLSLCMTMCHLCGLPAGRGEQNWMRCFRCGLLNAE